MPAAARLLPPAQFTEYTRRRTRMHRSIPPTPMTGSSAIPQRRSRRDAHQPDVHPSGTTAPEPVVTTDSLGSDVAAVMAITGCTLKGGWLTRDGMRDQGCGDAERVNLHLRDSSTRWHVRN